LKSELVTLLLAANVFFSFIVVAQEQNIQSGQDKRGLDSKRSLAAMESMPILDKYKGSRFVETRKLQSFSMRALLVCQLTEKILAVAKQTYLMRQTPEDLAKSMDIYREGQVCVEQTQKTISEYFRKSQAELQKLRPRAVDKLKAYHSTWLSVVRGMPRDVQHPDALEIEQQRDNRSVTAKETELDVELE